MVIALQDGHLNSYPRGFQPRRKVTAIEAAACLYRKHLFANAPYKTSFVSCLNTRCTSYPDFLEAWLNYICPFPPVSSEASSYPPDAPCELHMALHFPSHRYLAIEEYCRSVCCLSFRSPMTQLPLELRTFCPLIIPLRSSPRIRMLPLTYPRIYNPHSYPNHSTAYLSLNAPYVNHLLQTHRTHRSTPSLPFSNLHHFSSSSIQPSPPRHRKFKTQLHPHLPTTTYQNHVFVVW
jgi:hypothetical protein